VRCVQKLALKLAHSASDACGELADVGMESTRSKRPKMIATHVAVIKKEGKCELPDVKKSRGADRRRIAKRGRNLWEVTTSNSASPLFEGQLERVCQRTKRQSLAEKANRGGGHADITTGIKNLPMNEEKG